MHYQQETNPSEIAERAYDEALTQIQLQRSDVERVWATGTYRKQAKSAIISFQMPSLTLMGTVKSTQR